MKDVSLRHRHSPLSLKAMEPQAMAAAVSMATSLPGLSASILKACLLGSMRSGLVHVL